MTSFPPLTPDDLPDPMTFPLVLSDLPQALLGDSTDPLWT